MPTYVAASKTYLKLIIKNIIIVNFTIYNTFTFLPQNVSFNNISKFVRDWLRQTEVAIKKSTIDFWVKVTDGSASNSTDF